MAAEVSLAGLLVSWSSLCPPQTHPPHRSQGTCSQTRPSPAQNPPMAPTGPGGSAGRMITALCGDTLRNTNTLELTVVKELIFVNESRLWVRVVSGYPYGDAFAGLYCDLSSPLERKGQDSSQPDGMTANLGNTHSRSQVPEYHLSCITE